MKINKVVFDMFSDATFSTTVENVYEVIKNILFSIRYIKAEWERLKKNESSSTVTEEGNFTKKTPEYNHITEVYIILWAVVKSH